MTQATTQLPHFQRKPGWLAKEEYDCHVIGSITEGLGIHMEFSYKNIGDDSNVAIDNVQKAIKRLHDHRRARSKPLPRVMYLQLDNVSHNKGQNMMAYLSYLVESDVFEKVKVNYLLVGHTHEIIDQVFSRYSVALRRKDCLTLSELMEVAKTCYTPNPTVQHVQDVTDWAKWFDTKDCCLPFGDMHFNQQFRFKKRPQLAAAAAAEAGPSSAPVVSGPPVPPVAPASSEVRIHSRCLGWRPDNAETKAYKPKGGVQRLVQVPPGEPEAKPLTPLGDTEYASLEKIVAGFEENFGAAYQGELKEYWESQVDFQRGVRDHMGDMHPQTYDFLALQVTAPTNYPS
jgi:hypothetical protein